MKVSVLGCGLRTPLLLSALLRTGRVPSEIWLYDLDPEHAELMAALGRRTVPDSTCKVVVAGHPEDAIADSDFVICSIRPGGMAMRARDERICVGLGYAGQETVGPAGAAMAWRTIPAVLQYAGMVARFAPKAWFVNFTNPAGMVTQAILDHGGVQSVGICDTPAELFYRIALAFDTERSGVRCDYVGLNHLGFVTRVWVDGVDRTGELLADEVRLASLYPAPLFPASLIRQLGAIPTEYCFFYYRPGAALQNQKSVDKTRGEELMELNGRFFADVLNATKRDGAAAGLRVYERYLNHRNASYLRLEGVGESAFTDEVPSWDPFEAVTGYHRIAVDTIQALSGTKPSEIVLNVRNEDTTKLLLSGDVIETNCALSLDGCRRLSGGVPFPLNVQGLVQSVKAYERALAAAAVAQDHGLFCWALTLHPSIADWDAAVRLTQALLRSPTPVRNFPIPGNFG